MALGDMEHDRPRLEQGEIAFFIGWHLPERMEHTMRGFLHLSERNKTNAVTLAHFFKRPANAHVTRESLAAIGRPFKGGNGGGHWNAPHDCITPLMENTAPTIILRMGSLSLPCTSLRRTDRFGFDMSGAALSMPRPVRWRRRLNCRSSSARD